MPDMLTAWDKPWWKFFTSKLLTTLISVKVWIITVVFVVSEVGSDLVYRTCVQLLKDGKLSSTDFVAVVGHIFTYRSAVYIALLSATIVAREVFAIANIRTGGITKFIKGALPNGQATCDPDSDGDQ